jgi:hypothetical protein
MTANQLDLLLDRFPITDRELVVADSESSSRNVDSIFEAVAGCTLDQGFYRFHTPVSGAHSDIACSKLIDGFRGKYHCFAVDWLGREVAVEILEEPSLGKVVVVDPGGGEYLDPSSRLSQWHGMVAGEDDVLAYSFYQEWRQQNPSFTALRFDQAVGYKVPLFLGGDDTVANLEVIDRAVYFDICTQMSNEASKLPIGTSINYIRAWRDGHQYKG